MQVVNITDPGGNLTGALQAAAAAQQTKQGRARLALVAALGDTPGWFTPLSPEPGPKNYTAQEANQFEWFSQVDGPFIFALRAELEARAGGNPSWTTGVNYTTQLAMSADSAEVAALYKAAGLNLQCGPGDGPERHPDQRRPHGGAVRGAQRHLRRQDRPSRC